MFGIYKEIWKLVRSSISYLQISIFSISSLVGMFVIFLAFHCFIDFTQFVQKDSGIFKKDFIIVSKKVSLLQTISNRPAQFSNREIENVKEQRFVKQIDFFTASQFSVTLYTESERLPYFRTDFFFESVPSNYINIEASKWQWNEGSTTIPIIFPKNFISLYNFGYAPSRGLPQLSESVFSNIPLKVAITGNGERKIYDAQVVGFSQKINTILVPDNFLKQANIKYGDTTEVIKPSRIILDCENLADPEIFTYITKNDLEINDETLVNSKLSYYLRLGLSIIGFIGLIITALAVWLLIFSFQLIIEKNKTKIQSLRYLGFSVSNITIPYNTISLVLTPFLVAIAAVASFVVHGYIVEQVELIMPITTAPIWQPIAFAIAVCIIIVSINYLFIRNSIRRM